MKRKNIFRKIICISMCIILSTGTILSEKSVRIKAEEESSSGSESDGSDADGTDTTTTDERKWFDERGIKLTTYILATNSLNYLLKLHPDLESYIVHSRPNMMVLDGGWEYNGNPENIPYSSVRKVLNKYIESADYFNSSSEMYIADFFQQLGRPIVIQTETVGLNNFTYKPSNAPWTRNKIPGTKYTGFYSKPGVILSTTSPQYHLSQLEDKAQFNSIANVEDTTKYSELSDTNLEKVLNACRTEFEYQIIEKMSVQGTKGDYTIKLGNYIDMGTAVMKNSSTENIFGFDFGKTFKDVASHADGMTEKTMNNPNAGSTSKINEYTKKLQYAQMAIQGAILTGMYTDGVPGIGKIESMTTSTGSLLNKEKTQLINEEITIKVKGKNSNQKINSQNLINKFLSKYEINGETYTKDLLNLSENDKNSFSNCFGSKYTFLVVMETVGCDYERNTWWLYRKNKDLAIRLWGEQAETIYNNRSEFGDMNGNMFSIRDRFYMWSNWKTDLTTNGKNFDDVNNSKGVSGYRSSPAGYSSSSKYSSYAATFNKKYLPKKDTGEQRMFLDPSITCDEQYNFGLSLNYIIADNANGVFDHGKRDAKGNVVESSSVYGQSSTWQMIGVVNKVTFGEFNVTETSTTERKTAKNHKNGQYSVNSINILMINES